MSKYNELVKRLRVAEVGEAFQTEDGSPELLPTELGLDAADAIEALVGDLSVMRLKLEAKLSTEQSEEVARLKAMVGSVEFERDVAWAEIVRLKAENKRLEDRIANLGWTLELYR